MYCTQMSFVSLVSCNFDPNEEWKHIHEIREISSNRPLNSSGRVKIVSEQMILTLEGLCLTEIGCRRACYAKLISKRIQFQFC